ncbi:unnamed protein product [Lampetra fluviatilis]
MSVVGDVTPLETFEMLFLFVLYILGSSLSVIGCLSVIIFSVYRGIVADKEVRVLLQLMFADLVASALLLYSATVPLLPEELYVWVYEYCKYSVVGALCFYSCSLALVLVYALEVYGSMLTFSGVSCRRWPAMCRGLALCGTWPLYIFCWLLPPSLFSIYVGVVERHQNQTLIAPVWENDRHSNDSSQYCTRCLPLIHQPGECQGPLETSDLANREKLIFLAYLSVVVMTCGMLYYLVRRGYRDVFEPQSSTAAAAMGACPTGRYYRTVVKSTTLFQASLFLCWVPGWSRPTLLPIDSNAQSTNALVICMVSFNSDVPHKSMIYLQVVQACTLPLQGLLNSVLYGWQRRSFRSAGPAQGTTALLQREPVRYLALASAT